MKAPGSETRTPRGNPASVSSLLALAALVLLGGCEDVITPIIQEDVRQAELPDYTLTVLPPAAGSVTPSGDISLKQGQSVSVTAVAPEGYVFINWEVSEGSESAAIGDSASSSTTVSLLSGDAVIQPIITNTPRVLTVANDGHGTTSPSGGVTVGNGQARTLVATANAAQGYEFDSWIQTGGEGTAAFGNAGSANTTVVVTGGDAAIEARFRLKQYTVTITNDGHGTTVPTSSIVVTHGATSGAISATPSAGYSFLNWTGPAGITFANANSASTTFTATAGDATIRANFQGLSYTLTLSATGPGSVTSPASPATVTHGVAVAIQASAPSSGGHYFSGWTKTAGVGNAIFADASASSTTVTVTGGNATVTANYSTISATLTRKGTLLLESGSYVTDQRIDVVNDILYDSGFAYVVGSFGGQAKLVKIDVSNPNSPTFDSSRAFAAGGVVNEIIKDGSYLHMGVSGTNGDRYRSSIKSGSGLNPVTDDLGFNDDVEDLSGNGWVAANNQISAYGVMGSLDVGSDDPLEDILYIPSFNYLYVTRAGGMSNDGFAEVYYTDGDQVLLEASRAVTDYSPGAMVFNGSEYIYAASGPSGIITFNVDYDYFDDVDIMLPNANTGQPTMAAIAGNYLVSIGTAATDRLAVFDIHYENGSAGNPYYLSSLNRYAQGVRAIDANGSYVYTVEGAYLVIYELVKNYQ